MQLIEDLLGRNGIQVLAVSYRVKAEDSARAKVARSASRYSDFADLHDFLGVRVVCYLASDVEKVQRLLTSEFEIDPARSLDKVDSLDPDRFGYLSYHLVGQIGSNRGALAEWAPFAGFPMEIQIRSVLQHAWAEIEHDLGYKSSSGIPAHLKRRFARLAGLLELADAEFDGISQQVADHVEQVSRQVADGDVVPVDRDSIQALIASDGSIARADRDIAARTGAVIDHTPSGIYADARAEELLDVGLTNTSAVIAALEKEEAQLTRFAAGWLMNPADVKNIDEDEDLDDNGHFKRLPAGISLFYLYLHELVANERYNELESVGSLGDSTVRIQFLEIHHAAYKDSHG
ncbi:GTP pyrophosphokinase [Microbacterium sp. Clip185]|uniref:GTP pyrophosphokinase n=1 Tax=Microbacterium sp. Clip185 TaxID=3025663 RepID=UPI0023668F51|nr:hypothetical protein [Microbacterium sp. Clip185]WDG18266.1 hypothetical protein PQV94_00675 [Microbacterium sp. Clip185]